MALFAQQSARMTVPGGPSVACSTAAAVEWDKAWAGNLDPSGRAALGCHDDAYSDKEGEKAPSTAAPHENGHANGAPFPKSKPIDATVLQSQAVH